MISRGAPIASSPSCNIAFGTSRPALIQSSNPVAQRPATDATAGVGFGCAAATNPNHSATSGFQSGSGLGQAATERPPLVDQLIAVVDLASVQFEAHPTPVALCAPVRGLSSPDHGEKLPAQPWGSERTVDDRGPQEQAGGVCRTAKGRVLVAVRSVPL